MMRFRHISAVLLQVRNCLTPEGSWCPTGAEDAAGEGSWAPSVMTVRRSVFHAMLSVQPLGREEWTGAAVETVYRFLCDYREDIDPTAPDFFKPSEGVTQADILAALDRAADLCDRLQGMDLYVPSGTRHYPDLKTYVERLELIERGKENSDAS